MRVAETGLESSCLDTCISVWQVRQAELQLSINYGTGPFGEGFVGHNRAQPFKFLP